MITRWTDGVAGKPEDKLWMMLARAVKYCEEISVAQRLSEEFEVKKGRSHQPSHEDDDDDDDD